MNYLRGKNARIEQTGGTPDLLVTNYSMLEYMLLRPIEQPLFNSTKDEAKQAIQ